MQMVTASSVLVGKRKVEPFLKYLIFFAVDTKMLSLYNRSVTKSHVFFEFIGIRYSLNRRLGPKYYRSIALLKYN